MLANYDIYIHIILTLFSTSNLTTMVANMSKVRAKKHKKPSRRHRSDTEDSDVSTAASVVSSSESSSDGSEESSKEASNKHKKSKKKKMITLSKDELNRLLQQAVEQGRRAHRR